MSKFRKLGLLWCLAGILILSSYCGIAKAAENTGVVPHGKKLFKSDGIFVVPDNVTTVWVTMVGGGGGGVEGYKWENYTDGSSEKSRKVKIYSWGGDGASIFCEEIKVTPGESISVTVGVAGAILVAGGDSTFGGYISCPGGKAGYTFKDSAFRNDLRCTAGADGGPRYFETCYGIGGSGYPSDKNYPRGTNGMVLVEW